MEVHLTSDRVAVTGSGLDSLASEAAQHQILARVQLRSSPFSLELINSEELAQLPPSRSAEVDRICANLDLQHIVPIGIGANQVSSSLSWYGTVHFNIQLTVLDDPNVKRGYHTLLPGQFPSHPSLALLDHLIFDLAMRGDSHTAQELSVQTCSQYSDSEKGFLRLGDAAFTREQWKLAMLAYGQAHDLAVSQQKVAAHCVKRIQACAQHTEIGPVFLDEERCQLPPAIRQLLLRPWQSHTREVLSTLFTDGSPSLCFDSTQRPFIPVPSSTHSLQDDPSWSRLPRFFRWVIPFAFALMSTPRDADDIALLANPMIGIRHVITLTEESPLDRSWFAQLGSRVRHTFISIPNYQSPTIEQMDIILHIFADESNLPVLVHCGGGKGRAGTVAACYLAAFGFSPAPLQAHRDSPAMESSAAIAALRMIRPGSIETAQQEAFVQRYVSAMWKRQSVLPEAPSEPAPCAIDIQGKLPVAKDIDMLMLVGLPGSGKSWLAQSLLKREPDKWTWVSQDEIGGRSGVEDAVGRNGGRKSIILDRCNCSAEDRKWFLRLADLSTAPLRAVCVWFDYSSELCTWRAQNRPDHPTLPPGGRVRAAVKQMQETLVKPTPGEGFAAVVTLRSFAAANELVRQLSPPIGLLKFPRTPHLINLGAATSDDMVVSLSSQASRFSDSEVVITEKVDGANMGFSLAADRMTILVQNRSHYVNPASHEQFRRLGSWIDRHQAALVAVLDRDPMFSERFILYGEWLAATHSISYSKLPGLFMAFDLYDRANRIFVDRSTLEGLLHDSGISLTPTVYRGPLLEEKLLVEMASAPSAFCDGAREGIYVKWERAGRVVDRAKIVRPDFIAGNEHWTKGIIRLNTIIDYET
ncbi:hypothetical protein BKA62DRAFT_804087 [Auriculariales sp. MPI-PUGE-AT-0066]|nr:hypothetical protein BKA62DRAFT_804087 [Auriculariales sp. MPI-PUGE-AT-0066]